MEEAMRSQAVSSARAALRVVTELMRGEVEKGKVVAAMEKAAGSNGPEVFDFTLLESPAARAYAGAASSLAESLARLLSACSDPRSADERREP